MILKKTWHITAANAILSVRLFKVLCLAVLRFIIQQVFIGHHFRWPCVPRLMKVKGTPLNPDKDRVEPIPEYNLASWRPLSWTVVSLICDLQRKANQSLCFVEGAAPGRSVAMASFAAGQPSVASSGLWPGISLKPLASSRVNS